jgi:hypothetical protein
MHDFYYLKLKNGESKPLVLYQIRELCKNGVLSRDILFRYDGSDKWIPLSELLGDGLFDDGFIVQYYIKATPSDKGPFTLIQLRQILADGEISGDDLYRTNTIKDWHKVSEFEDLRLTECELVAQRAELYKPSERNDTTATYEECTGSNRETKSNAKSGCLIAILSILCIGVVGALFDQCTGSNHRYNERSYEQTKPEHSTNMTIPNENLANPSDLRQAKDMLRSLPSACNRSYISVSSDGTVNIRVLCSDSSKATDATITIKDGKVTGVDGGTFIGR